MVGLKNWARTASSVLAAGLLCAVGLGAGPAAANTLIKATYHGTITSLLDKDGLLGTVIDANTASDLAFTDTFVFDAGKGTRTTSATEDLLVGGDFFGAASPLVSSKLTIGGVTLSFLGTFGFQQFNVLGVAIGSDATTLVPDGQVRANTAVALTKAPALLTTPYSDANAGAAGSNVFICQLTGKNCTDLRFRADLAVDSVSITAGVPEPASWALMILGFGGLGAALRRGRRAATAGAVGA